MLPIEADLLRLRLQHGRTLAPLGDGTGPPALVVSLTEFIYQLKLEAMIVKGAELYGLTPVFLVPDSAPLTERYLRAFGMRRFVRLSDYASDELDAQARLAAAQLLPERFTLRELAQIEYRGAAVGRCVLSTLVRARHEVDVDLGDPTVAADARRLLEVSLRSTLSAEALLDDLRPELVLFNERNYAAEAPISDLALKRGHNVVQFVSAASEDALTFKRYTYETQRVHPRSVSDDTWRLVQKLPWTAERDAALDAELRYRYDKTNALARRRLEWTREWSPNEIRRELDLDDEKPTVVVYSHILWDANMFYGEDLFDDQQQWFVETLKAAVENPRANWVIKLHPDTVWKRKRDHVAGEGGETAMIAEHIGRLPAHVRVLEPETTISTRALFDATDVGVTIRGSVGVELPCLGIPVLTAGTGFYSGRGFTVDSATRAEYLERLATIEALPPLTPEQTLLARRHAYALFHLRPTRFTSFRSIIRPLAEMGTVLDHDLVVTAQSQDELRSAEDLNSVGRWMVESRDLDYVCLTIPD